MAGAASVLEDGSTLSRIDRGLNRFEAVLALLSGFAVFSLMVLAVISVGGRNFFNHPLPGYIDYITQIMPLIAFMGMAYMQRVGGHIRMDILIGVLRGRTLWAVEWLGVFITLLVCLLLAWGSWLHFLRSFDFAQPLWSSDSTMDIGLPTWPSKLLAPVAFIVMSLRLVVQLWAYGRATLLGLDRPVAAPMIESAAEQAAREASHVSGADQT
ncbi:MAG: TRAP transporter small permease [Neomegalonema sp.]|nr:TRAP transporter small permease [Neomegalonema sp.]